MLHACRIQPQGAFKQPYVDKHMFLFLQLSGSKALGKHVNSKLNVIYILGWNFILKLKLNL